MTGIPCAPAFILSVSYDLEVPANFGSRRLASVAASAGASSLTEIGETQTVYHLIRDLPESALVLDLGSGPGSFRYDATRARICSLDLAIPTKNSRSAYLVKGSASTLPFSDQTIDVVICNHTLEHFENISKCLREIKRILRPDGYLWASVPDASTLDDRLYRFLFHGGGHINQFSFDSFIELVQREAGLRAVSHKRLYTGFVYLNPPDPAKLPYYPRKAAYLSRIPPAILRFAVRWLNFFTRLCDKRWDRNWSLYGYAFTFNKGVVSSNHATVEDSAEDLNVCFACGSGHPAGTLQTQSQFFGLVNTYYCPACGERNIHVNTCDSVK